MQYKILDYKWKKIQITEELIQDYQSITIASAGEIEHNQNIDTFEQAVQAAICEGWEPLGPPQFIDGWINGSTKRILQPMICKDDVTNREPLVPTTPKSTTIMAVSNPSPRKVPLTYVNKNKKTGITEKSSVQFRY